MSKPITMLDLCRAHPEKAAERIEALIKRNAELEKERGAAVFLAEQRRQFIVNGVELGYIPHPTIEEDKAANLTILMCGFDDSHSMEAHNLEQQAKGLSEGFHATKEPIGRNSFGFMMHYCSEKNLKDRVDDLRNQAKALKDKS
jgi:hypothetical protein